MAFDFPNAPIEGQIFAPPGGPRYKFQGQVWDVVSPPVDYDDTDLAQITTYYVSPTGLVTNAGLVVSEPTTIQNAIDLIRKNAMTMPWGTWRIQFAAGTYNVVSVYRLSYMPATVKLIELVGPDAAWGTPTAILSGGGVSPGIFRVHWDSQATRYKIKDLKITAVIGEAIHLWQRSGHVEVENLHVDGASVGLAVRRSYLTIDGGKFENCSDTGVQAQHHSSGQIGPFQGAGHRVTFTNCGNAVEVGRHSNFYVEHSDFVNSTTCHIVATMVSRVRQRGNSYGVAGIAMIVANMNSAVNGDPPYANTFPGAVLGQPAFLFASGGVKEEISRGPVRVGHYSAAFDNIVCAGDARLIIGGVDSALVPFRLPNYFMANERNRLIVEYDIFIPTNNSPLFEFAGDSSSTNAVGVSIQPALYTTNREALLRFELGGPRPSDKRGRGFAELKFMSGPVPYQFSALLAGAFTNTYYWAPNETEKLWRVYLTNSPGLSVTFRGMRSWIEY